MHYAERERLLLAPYATHAADSAGRGVPEPDHPYRSPYQRDRDRITHSAAFRRLSHKTQVFTRELAAGDGDYHRSRLTHTLEVASIARTLARALRLNEDLVEALALAHDVGHPPFGHAGEAVLDHRLRDHGGFNHNRQAVRLFTRLEARYPDRPGLNLTAEVLEGQRARGAKPARTPASLDNESPAPAQEPETASGQSLEAQVVDAADSIAYDAHDVDDALEIGLLSPGDLDGVMLWRESAERVAGRYAAASADDLRRATVHELLDRQVGDLLRVTRAGLDRAAPGCVAPDSAAPDSAAFDCAAFDCAAAVRAAPTLARHSAEMAEQRLELEAFLFARVYRHPLVLEHRAEATAALEERFDRALQSPAIVPARFAPAVAEESLHRAVADYLASLTDRAVLQGLRGGG